MTEPDGSSSEIDIDRPSMARVYDYFLGGSHNFAVDRAMAEQVLAARPDTPQVVQQNRMFGRRAVEFMVAAGIVQFIDIGSGIPTAGNTHEIAAARNPDIRVVYVDIDQVALAHSAQLLREDPTAIVIDQDLRDPVTLLADPDLNAMLDLRRPVGILATAVVHFLRDEDDPAAIFAVLRGGVAPGSYFAITSVTSDDNSETASAVGGAYRRAGDTMHFRTHDEIAELFFAGLDLVPPGLVRVPLWRPVSREDAGEAPERYPGYGGVGVLRASG